jgi:hypothetical protein
MSTKRLMLLVAALALSCHREQKPEYVLEDLGRCATIDKSTHDDGFLGRVRAALGKRKLLHQTSDAAADNLRACSGGRPAGIIGHGVPGVLYFSFDLGNSISIANQSWYPGYSDLRGKVGTITILSCDTGAEEDGARLLRELSDLAGVRVRARTGFTYADKDGTITFEDGSEWQIAEPPPAGLPPVKHHPRRSTFEFPLRQIMLGRDSFALSDIRKITITGFSATQPQRSALLMSLRDDEARNASSSIHFRSEFHPRGEPAAMVTGVAELTFKTNAGLVTRRVEIYNDRVARDLADRTRFFDIDSSLSDALCSARRAYKLF